MVYRLILDENVEHDVLHRLDNYGHDVEHVDFVPSLGKGTKDHPIAQYSLETDRLIVTYDDDFVLEIDEDDYRAVSISVMPPCLSDRLRTSFTPSLRSTHRKNSVV